MEDDASSNPPDRGIMVIFTQPWKTAQDVFFYLLWKTRSVFIYLSGTVGPVFTGLFWRIGSVLVYVWQWLSPQQSTMTRKSAWTVTSDGQGSTVTEHAEEITRDGRLRARSEHRESSDDDGDESEDLPGNEPTDPPRPASQSVRVAVPGGRGGGGVSTRGPRGETLARLQGDTFCSTRNAATAEALMKSEAESEKRQMEIIQAMLDRMSPRQPIQ